MKVRSGNPVIGHGHFDDGLTPGVASFIANFGRRPKTVDAAQARVVVQRLRVLLGEAVAGAKRCGVDLTAAQFIRVCDDLLREVRECGYRPDYGTTSRGTCARGSSTNLCSSRAISSTWP